jgi:hypothetical protein
MTYIVWQSGWSQIERLDDARYRFSFAEGFTLDSEELTEFVESLKKLLPSEALTRCTATATNVFNWSHTHDCIDHNENHTIDIDTMRLNHECSSCGAIWQLLDSIEA